MNMKKTLLLSLCILSMCLNGCFDAVRLRFGWPEFLYESMGVNGMNHYYYAQARYACERMIKEKDNEACLIWFLMLPFEFATETLFLPIDAIVEATDWGIYRSVRINNKLAKAVDGETTYLPVEHPIVLQGVVSPDQKGLIADTINGKRFKEKVFVKCGYKETLKKYAPETRLEMNLYVWTPHGYPGENDGYVTDFPGGYTKVLDPLPLTADTTIIFP